MIAELGPETTKLVGTGRDGGRKCSLTSGTVPRGACWERLSIFPPPPQSVAVVKVTVFLASAKLLPRIWPCPEDGWPPTSDVAPKFQTWVLSKPDGVWRELCVMQFLTAVSAQGALSPAQSEGRARGKAMKTQG